MASSLLWTSSGSCSGLGGGGEAIRRVQSPNTVTKRSGNDAQPNTEKREEGR